MTITSAWSPCKIGDTTLGHRVVLAPLTRGRGTISKLNPGTSHANDLMKLYYTERVSPGGLLITEATPVSQRASGSPGVSGWFTQEQVDAWKPIVDEIHARGGFIFTQLWHQGRNTHSMVCGQQPESSSAVANEGLFGARGKNPVPFEVPKAMTPEEIEATQNDFVNGAIAAVGAGCDGIEIHAGNGYLFDQFHHSNVNQRTDKYGGSPEKRCVFTLETVDKLAAAIGPGRVAVRLSPFGLFNGMMGEQRMEQWLYLCSELSKRNVAYVHLIEPRFDEFKSASEKQLELTGMGGSENMTLAPFREALGSTVLLSAGGFGPANFEEGIKNGSHDLVAFGRYFCANADLVERLQTGKPLYKWDRSRFYGPFDDNEIGYTVHPNRVLADINDGLKAQFGD